MPPSKTWFTVTIPVPPSVNHLHASAKGGRRYKTRLYRAWERDAAWEIRTQHPGHVIGKYALTLILPKIRGDIDNRLKPVLDLLHRLGITPDDRHCVNARVATDIERKGMALVEVRQA